MTRKMKCITVRIEDDNTITVELISKNQKLIINKRIGLLFNMSHDKFISIFGENIGSTDVYYQLPDGSYECNYDYSFLYNMINKIVTIVDGRIVDINTKVSTVRLALRWALVVIVLGIIGIIINIILLMLI